MSSSHLPPRYRHSSTFSSISDFTDRVSSPSVEPEAWPSQQPILSLTPTPSTQSFRASQTPIPSSSPSQRSVYPITKPSPDLFTALIFDRDQLYRDSSVAPVSGPAEPNSPNRRRLSLHQTESPEDLDVEISTLSSFHHHPPTSTTRRQRTSNTPSFLTDSGSKYRSMSVVPCLKDNSGIPKVSKRRGRPPKKTAAKSKGKIEENKNKKRPVTEDEESKQRTPKAPKLILRVKVNTSKKVDTGGSLVPIKSSSTEIIEILSDFEEDLEKINKEKKKVEERSTSMLSHLMGRRQPQRASTHYTRPATRSQTPSSNIPKAKTPDIIPDLTPSPPIAVKEAETVVGELAKVRLELQAATEKARRLQQDMEKQQADTMLERQKAETKHKQELANFIRDLGTERQKSRGLGEQLQNSSMAHEKLKAEHQALQDRYEREKRERKQEQTNHADGLEDILKPKSEDKDAQQQLESLRKDNTRLSVENAALKAATAMGPFQSRSLLSPAPSSTSSSASDDKKEDNVRKMYIKTKRQHDILQAVANDLVKCTRSMDLSSFGEFGRYVNKLKVTLEVDDGGHVRPVANVLKADEDDEWGSQGSRG